MALFKGKFPSRFRNVKEKLSQKCFSFLSQFWVASTVFLSRLKPFFQRSPAVGPIWIGRVVRNGGIAFSFMKTPEQGAKSLTFLAPVTVNRLRD